MLKHIATSAGANGAHTPPGPPGRHRAPVTVLSPSALLHQPHPHPLGPPRLNHSHALNISTLSTSKHSLGNSSSVSPGAGVPAASPPAANGPVGHVTTPTVAPLPLPLPLTLTPPKMANGGLHIPRVRATSLSAGSALIPANVSKFMERSKEAGIKEMLTSLGLLCLVSLLLALLSLIFLLKISPMTTTDIREVLRSEHLTVISAEEYVVVYEVTLALCALTLSLNLCCLLVCAIQFLFAVKLVKSTQGGNRTNKYLQKSAITRVCAVGGFFVSIPVFLTGIILYTFIQFHSTPAIVTSVFIGLGIIFCGCAMVHNVFVWQKVSATSSSSTSSSCSSSSPTTSPTSLTTCSSTPQYYYRKEKTDAVRALAQQHRDHSHRQAAAAAAAVAAAAAASPSPPGPLDLSKVTNHPRQASGSISPGMPTATLDLSTVTTSISPHELSTLV